MHQTLKSIMDGQSKRQIDAMFSERDHGAMEWVKKGAIKEEALRSRRAAKHHSPEE